MYNYRGRMLPLAIAPFVAATWQPAAAQSITLYGVADAAITIANSGATTVKGISSGVFNSSRWGIRGSEDLGGGLRALFQIEAGFDLDIGAAKPYAGNPSTATPTAPNGTVGTGFNRRTYVGLAGKYGTLTFGRDYTPVFYAGLEADVFKLGLFGNLQLIVPMAAGTERWARVSNAVFYHSPIVKGFRSHVAYSLGSESLGESGKLPKGANEFAGINIEYTYSDLILIGSYQALKYPVVAGRPAAFTGATATRSDAMIGIKYNLGAYTLTTGYWRMGRPQNASDIWLGASMRIGPGSMLAQVSALRQDNPTGAERKGTSFGIAYVHQLAKRVAIYVNYGQISNNVTGAFPLVSGDTSVAASNPGADPKVLALGINHHF